MKKKLKKKEREERLKKEGKFLTEKQKQDKRRLEQMLEAMKEAGEFIRYACCFDKICLNMSSEFFDII